MCMLWETVYLMHTLCQCFVCQLLAACSAIGDTCLQVPGSSFGQQLSLFCPFSLFTESMELAFAVLFNFEWSLTRAVYCEQAGHA